MTKGKNGLKQVWGDAYGAVVNHERRTRNRLARWRNSKRLRLRKKWLNRVHPQDIRDQQRAAIWAGFIDPNGLHYSEVAPHFETWTRHEEER